MNYHKVKGKSIYLYDITGSYFEGRENELAAFGYNRDKKVGKMQICIGLITDSNGFPLKITVFKGNVTDTLTVEEQILDLQKQTGIDNLIFVGDRGMQIIYHTENDESLQSSQLQFITGLTHAQIKKMMDTQTIELQLFNREIAEVWDGNYRYILSINPDLEVREKFFLNSHKNKLNQNLEHIRNRWKDRHIKNLENQIKLSKETGKKRKLKTSFSEKDIEGYKKRVNLLLAQQCTGKYYTIEAIDNQQFTIKFDEKQYQTDLDLCGKYVICSNVPEKVLDKHEVRQEYKNLQKVEHGFRDLKSENISIRPIYHRKEHQTRGHVQICFWAYAIIKTMEDKIYPFIKTFNEEEKKQLSFNDIIAELKNIKLVEIKLGKSVHTVKYAKLNDLQQKIMELFDLNPDDMIAMMNGK
jgi:transposase